MTIFLEVFSQSDMVEYRFHVVGNITLIPSGHNGW